MGTASGRWLYSFKDLTTAAKRTSNDGGRSFSLCLESCSQQRAAGIMMVSAIISLTVKVVEELTLTIILEQSVVEIAFQSHGRPVSNTDYLSIDSK